MLPERIPSYEDLPIDPSLPPHSAWRLFGDDDRIGTLNFITDDEVRYASSRVRKGRVFSLNWDIALPEPPILGRERLKSYYVKQFAGWDDYYDSFYPQASTQWDALNHVHHPTYAYYNGHPAVDGPQGPRPPLGIEDFARRGIVSRFVLLDVGRHREEIGEPLDYSSTTLITCDELDRVAERQGVEFRQGDVLMLRFGWIGWYEQLVPEARAALGTGEVFPNPGLAAQKDSARWLWDHRIAAVVSDNPTLEATPFDQTHEGGFLHYRLIPLLGLAVGELFVMDELARDCADDQVYEGLFTAAPLNHTGGAGSPGNALAIK
jgi:kynurenine formamidase